MNRLLLTLSLAIAANAFAVRLEVPARSAAMPIESARKVEALRKAIGVFDLANGSLWVRLAPSAQDPNAIPVIRFAPDDSATEFFLSEWLQKGTLPNDRGGQVHAVTQLDDGRVAVSGGWNDGKESYNAVFILRPRDDGRYDTDKIIKMPGVSAIAAIGGNHIVAVTDDAMRADHGPLLTLLDAEGHKRGILPNDPAMSVMATVQNASSAQLQRTGKSSVAFYNPAEQKVYLLELNAAAKDDVLAEKRIVSIADDASLAALHVIGMHLAEDGDLIVARVGQLDGAVGTHLSIYGRDNNVKRTVFLDRPWSRVLWKKGRIEGVVPGKELSLDTVTLASD